MTKPKPSFTGEPIHPHFTYRLHSPVVFGVIGLGATQLKEAIDKGELPPPIDLTPSGRAKAYTGQQLLDIQAQRVTRATERQARRVAKGGEARSASN
jgi:hypothetical protein